MNRNRNYYEYVMIAIALALATLILMIVFSSDDAEAQTTGSAPGCAFTYDPGPATSYDGYLLTEDYLYVDVFAADGTPHRIQPAPTGIALQHPSPNPIVRMTKCYGQAPTPDPTATPEVLTPTPTAQVPVPSLTPEANPTPEPTNSGTAPAPDVLVEVFLCTETGEAASYAYATADGPGWIVVGTDIVLVPGERTLIVGNGMVNLVHPSTGEQIPVSALATESCGVPEPTQPPAPDEGVDLDTTPDEGSPVPPLSPDDDNDLVSPNDDTDEPGTTVPPQTQDDEPAEGDVPARPVTGGSDGAPPVPGEDVLAYTDSQATNALFRAGMWLLVTGGLFAALSFRLRVRA